MNYELSIFHGLLAYPPGWPSMRPVRKERGGLMLFGEVLFDCFGEDERLGGAPFNVACHLHGLGAPRPVLVTRVGRDARGARLEQDMRARGLSLDGVQHDVRRPTGWVRVVTGDAPDGHRFEIEPGQAWDAIHGDHARVVGMAHKPSWVYFGTLAQRSASRQALLELMRVTGAAGFLDVNLRQSWWSNEVLRWSLGRAETVKMTETELALITHALGFAGTEPLQQVEWLMNHFGPARLIVTRGEQGAWLIDVHAGYLESPALPVRLVDSVGAGDAFAAVCLLGQWLDWPLDCLLVRASSLAAAVCELPGALPETADFYAPFLAAWFSERRTK